MDYYEPYCTHSVRRDILLVLLSISCTYSIQAKAEPLEEQIVPDVVSTEKRYLFSPEFTISFPQPLLVGLEVRNSDDARFRVFFDTGYFQYPIPIKKLGLKEFSFESGVRYSPPESGFSFSLGAGYRRISSFADVSSVVVGGGSLATGANIVLHTLYLAPEFFYKIDLSKKIEISFGLGVQIPALVLSSMSFENSGADSTDLSVNSFPYLNRVARIILPRVTLLRWIWHFD